MRHVRALRLETEEPSQDPERVDDYERLLRDYWGPLVRYARDIIGSPDGAEDAVQEAFVALWQRRDPLEPERVAPFLYRAVRNRALNERRWRRVRDLWRASLADNDAYLPVSTDEEAIDQRVRAAVSMLPPRRREVFELSRFHELTYQQIALTLSMAPQTVANHMSAALRDLRQSLADLMDDREQSAPTDD